MTISDFTDVMKEQMLKTKTLEVAQIEPSLVNLQSTLGSVGVSGTTEVIQTNIGSAFYFHVPLHNVFNSPKSLLGDMRTGSIVFQNGVKL